MNDNDLNLVLQIESQQDLILIFINLVLINQFHLHLNLMIDFKLQGLVMEKSFFLMFFKCVIIFVFVSLSFSLKFYFLTPFIKVLIIIYFNL